MNQKSREQALADKGYIIIATGAVMVLFAILTPDLGQLSNVLVVLGAVAVIIGALFLPKIEKKKDDNNKPKN